MIRPNRSTLANIAIISTLLVSTIGFPALAAKVTKELPSFSDVGKKLTQERKDKAMEIGTAIFKGNPLDAPSCKKAIKSCRGYLGNSRNIPGRTNFTVSYSLPYGDAIGVTQSDARNKLYQMASEECARIKSYFKGDCTMSNLTIRSQARNNQSTLNGSAKYTVE